MAIFTPGPVVGQISGRIGGSVYSRNRGGPYIRNGAIPTLSSSIYAENAKQRLAIYSALWASLTSAQQLAWTNWAKQNPVTNRLGHKITLSGHMALVQLNVNIDNAGGTPILVPPVVAPPDGLLTLSASYDIGAGDFNISYTTTPLGASEVLFIWAAVVDNPGVSFVNNLYKLIQVTAAAAASPQVTEVNMALRFGTLIVGQRVFYRVQTVDQDTGLVSQPISSDGTIITT
jgi:hypothetical protein